ncbi:serine/threonine-protein kinase [Aeoliella mucimassa]|uniref:Serine/threonine-protein kinase StkP n=1 Tax=Aeoliella mucimassa TaxID=2527972 RepID=A0A518AVT7_9BACT|nr:serine/threonine-protein kinase [Aeoliella mucimassa]QDU58834.1 Serine/threonine-protein kinase StkP [Aeoliella mucimassa]
MDVRTPQPGQIDPELGGGEERTPVKFLYPTGSQPLEGYTIKRGIGRGGFGEVYFATSDAGKEVALKLIRRNLDVELRGVKHCLNLKHSNLIGIYDIRSDSLGDQWVVMEYVSGESLEDAIDRHPNGMPVEQVVRWMRGIGTGVAYLHNHGIVHRDLKPGNVFLDIDSTEGGTVKIGDYGLSKFISCSRRSGQTESVGTVHYMAPEIANGRYGREIDTYALGIMLYEMLTGHVPFEGESVGEVLMKHLTAEPDLSKLESPFLDIVKRTLAKDPEVRIGSVDELVSLLPDGRSVGPLHPEKIDGWTANQADGDGIGAAHLFPDTSVRGEHAAATPPPVPPKPMVREPIYDWVATNWNDTVDRWHQWPLHPVPKTLLMLGIIVLALLTIQTWGGLLAVSGVVYLFYYIIWSMVILPGELRRAGQQPPPPQPRRAHDHAQPPSGPPMSRAEQRRAATLKAHHLRTNWKEQVHKELSQKPLRDRATELLSAMVLSGIVCTFLSLLIVVVVGGNSSVERMPLHLWLSSVSTLGCWVVIAVSKFTEGRTEDQVPMRMWQMAGGSLVGLAAWGLAYELMIGVPYVNDAGVRFNGSMLSEVLDSNQSDYLQWYGTNAVLPDLMLCVMYFSLMMLVLRWWKLADYTRRTRLSLIGTGVAICGAWLLHFIFWFPQPTGVAVAGVIAVSTQLVSAWLPPSKRKSLAEQTMAV